MTPKGLLKRLEMPSVSFPIESKANWDASKRSSKIEARRPVHGGELSGNKRHPKAWPPTYFNRLARQKLNSLTEAVATKKKVRRNGCLNLVSLIRLAFVLYLMDVKKCPVVV